MTTDDPIPPGIPPGRGPAAGSEGDAGRTAEDEARAARLRENLARIEDLTRRLALAMAQRRVVDPGLNGPGQDVWLKAGAAFMAEAAQHPARLIERQASFWTRTLANYVEAQTALATGAPPAPQPAADKRFANPLWDTHPWFHWVKQQYLATAETVTQAVDRLEGLDPVDARRVAYFTRQILDMMAPTNFLATNPDALERAVATDGESLVRGLTNLVRDIEANRGDFAVTLADPEAFAVGRDLATTPGAVVYRNRLMELIQYAPATAEVAAIPVVIFPPWINKYYILDLRPENSLIGWLVGQGFTVFVASWADPDASHADVTLDDYIHDGVLRGIAEARRITGAPQVNAVGYCIAGTTLALTLSHLDRMGDASVRSATFLTTLTDFADQGEFAVFLTDDFVGGIERQVAVDGVLGRGFMARTFSYLRSNDLIWRPAIRSYMMGEPPPAFDLLYWNGDGTNLPGPMAIQYLRGLCQGNGFARGSFPVFGQPVSMAGVRVPVFAVACETDHIAGWTASFAGIRQFGAADKTFVLAQSGHIAGIVNPPGRGKYGHYVNDAPLVSAETWRAGAAHQPGSWWPRWADWLRARSDGPVPARPPGGPDNPPLGDAPGTYVRSGGVGAKPPAPAP